MEVTANLKLRCELNLGWDVGLPTLSYLLAAKISIRLDPLPTQLVSDKVAPVEKICALVDDASGTNLSKCSCSR